MGHDLLGFGDSLKPPEALRQVIPFAADAASDRLGWVGIGAVRYREVPTSELNPPAITHPRFVLFSRPPEELELQYEGVKRHIAPGAGSISVVPAGSAVHWRWKGRFDWLQIFLAPRLIARVAAEAFDLDPARVAVPPLDGVDAPQLRAAMGAVNAELSSGGTGGPLIAESLANVLAVHLIRHVLAPGRFRRAKDGALPRRRLCTVIEFIEGHLDSNPTLEQMAAVADLSTYHFARQFKAATGMPPHQYVIARRVERAKELLLGGDECSLAEVALRAGFSDQSQLTRHFKRVVGITPGQFRMPASIA